MLHMINPEDGRHVFKVIRRSPVCPACREQRGATSCNHVPPPVAAHISSLQKETIDRIMRGLGKGDLADRELHSIAASQATKPAFPPRMTSAMLSHYQLATGSEATPGRLAQAAFYGTEQTAELPEDGIRWFVTAVDPAGDGTGPSEDAIVSMALVPGEDSPRLIILGVESYKLTGRDHYKLKMDKLRNHLRAVRALPGCGGARCLLVVERNLGGGYQAKVYGDEAMNISRIPTCPNIVVYTDDNEKAGPWGSRQTGFLTTDDRKQDMVEFMASRINNHTLLLHQDLVSLNHGERAALSLVEQLLGFRAYPRPEATNSASRRDLRPRFSYSGKSGDGKSNDDMVMATCIAGFVINQVSARAIQRGLSPFELCL